jgi:hypothetical protein
VEWNLAEGSANLFIPVFPIPVEFRWIPEFIPECSPEWHSPERAGTEFHRNSVRSFAAHICLFICDGQQTMFVWQSWSPNTSLFFPPPPPCSSTPPATLDTAVDITTVSRHHPHS